MHMASAITSSSQLGSSASALLPPPLLVSISSEESTRAFLWLTGVLYPAADDAPPSSRSLGCIKHARCGLTLSYLGRVHMPVHSVFTFGSSEAQWRFDEGPGRESSSPLSSLSTITISMRAGARASALRFPARNKQITIAESRGQSWRSAILEQVT